MTALRSPTRTAAFAGAALLWLVSASAIAGDDDIRTWTDSTGKFKIEAKFVSLDKGMVTLEKEDGDEIKLPLKKLSKSDQKLAEKLAEESSENPFELKDDNPFSSKSKKPSKKTADDDDAGSGPKRIDTNLADAEQISLTPSQEGWKVEVSEPPAEMQFQGKIKTIALPPKSNFFEKQQGIAINVIAKKAVVGYHLGEPKPDGTTRIVICDLKSGKASPPAVASGLMSPLALHDDGEQILMRREEFGFGNQDRLEIWRAKGKKVIKQLEFTPYQDSWKSNNDVMWAAFLDEDHLATSSRGGKVVVWSYPEIEPQWTFQLCEGAVPALSPDRKYLAFSNGDQVGLLEVDKQEVIAVQPTSSKLQWPTMAYSPTGKQFGCTANDRVLAWSAETGELIAEVPANGIPFNGGSDFPADGFFLAGHKYLLDLENKLQFWQYEGMESIGSAGGMTFAVATDGQKPGALIAAALPHAGAVQLQKRALDDPNLFVFKEGTTVKLDASGITDPNGRAQAIAALTKALDEMNCKVADSGTITLAASVEGPKQREISYIGSGDYKVHEWISSAKFVYQGKVVWQSRTSNVPFVITLKRGENIEGVLRASEKPSFGWFEHVNLPKFLQKPSEGQGPQAGFGLGQSRFTPTGLK